MIKLPVAFCDDEVANKLISENINKILAKMMEYQMDTACAQKGIPGYNGLFARMEDFYLQIRDFVPEWITPEDATFQFVVFYLLVKSRRYYEMSLLQEYILDALIRVSSTLAIINTDMFKCEFRSQERRIVGNAMAEEYVQVVNNIYGVLRSKESVDKYTPYSHIPYPDQKISDFENICLLEEICLDDAEFMVLEGATSSEIETLRPERVFGPEITLPESWWTGRQDICDVPGNPAGTEYMEPECYMCYMDLSQDLYKKKADVNDRAFPIYI